MTDTDPMFSSHTDKELLTWYNSSVPKAMAMGVQFEPKKQFEERQQLVEACENLHSDMVLMAASKEAKTNGSEEPSPEPVTPPQSRGKKEEKETTVAITTATDDKAAAREAKKAAKAAAALAAQQAAEAAAKKAEKAAAREAKKAAKANGAPAPAAGTAPKEAKSGRTAFADTAKITWLIVGPEIPGAREGSEKHVRWALVRTMTGKTVAAFKAAEGNLVTLANAVEKGAAKVG